MARLSVVIPAFNAAKTVSASVTSVLQQTRTPDEVVVVDDGSTDGTHAALQEFEGRIKVIRQPNGGLAKARNTGCAACTGEFIAFMDADDLAHPRRFELQLSTLEARPDAVLCHTDFSSFGAGERVESFHRRYYRVMQTHAALAAASFASEGQFTLDETTSDPVPVLVGRIRQLQAHGNAVHPPTLLFHRSLMSAVGDFEPSLRNMCDWDWLFRASGHGPFCYIDKALLDYRLSPDQLSGPRHAVTALRNIIAIARRIELAEPELHARERAVFDREMGSYHLDLARALAASNKREAMAELVRGASLGVPLTQAARVLVKILVPSALLERRTKSE